MKKTDFYKGYEGYPEVIISSRKNDGEIVEEVHLWEGFFSDMIDALPLGPDGNWQGISAHYQFETGWLQSMGPWEFVDFDLFLKQLDQMDTSKFKFSTLDVFEVVRLLVQNCKELKYCLFIEQD